MQANLTSMSNDNTGDSDSEAKISLCGLAPVDDCRSGERIEGETAAETAKNLYDRYLRELLEVRR